MIRPILRWARAHRLAVLATAALLAILSARRVEVRKEARKQIEGCEDEAKIDRWIERASSATSIDDVLGR